MPVIARTTPFGSFAQYFSPLVVRNNAIIFCIPVLLKEGKGIKPIISSNSNGSTIPLLSSPRASQLVILPSTVE